MRQNHQKMQNQQTQKSPNNFRLRYTAESHSHTSPGPEAQPHCAQTDQAARSGMLPLLQVTVTFLWEERELECKGLCPHRGYPQRQNLGSALLWDSGVSMRQGMERFFRSNITVSFEWHRRRYFSDLNFLKLQT